MLPLNLVFVRHGESEGNVANAMSRKGDHSAFSAAFLERSSRTWRLTNLGIKQAISAGAWLKEQFPQGFDRYYVSEYFRAMETAHYLSLPSAVWYPEPDLRERDRGYVDVKSQEEMKKQWAYVLKQRTIDSFTWCPPGGESLAHLRGGRIRNHLGTLARECSNMNVVEVVHGEVMWTDRLLLERMALHRFYQLDESKNDKDRMHNCQILHYTRINPKTGVKEITYNWMRSVCPWDVSLSSNKWQKIVRPKYTNEELLELVNKQDRMIC